MRMKGKFAVGKIRFAVAGAGWRAMFYVRAAKMLPELFELTGVLCRTREKAEAFAAAHGVPAFHELGDLLATSPMFVVSCVNKAGMAQMIMRLLEANMPALSETPLAIELDTLREIRAVQQRTGTLLQLAEQYFLFPMHQARRAVLDMGLLGDVHTCELSMMHDYHAISMLRFYLGEENGPVDVRARRIVTPIAVAGDRDGWCTGERTAQEWRVLAQLVYADGRNGVYDFSGPQYLNPLRSSHLRILGTRGEIFDDEVRFLREGDRPAIERFDVHRDLLTGTIRAIDFDGKRVYANPFRADAAMSEDEIAVAEVLVRMGKAVRTGERFYPDAWMVRDAYLACVMADAAARDARIMADAREYM